MPLCLAYLAVLMPFNLCVADSLTRTEHNSDKELIGQGIGNIMSGLFGGLPGAGATMGTVVGIQAGARSALAGLIRSDYW